MNCTEGHWGEAPWRIGFQSISRNYVSRSTLSIDWLRIEALSPAGRVSRLGFPPGLLIIAYGALRPFTAAHFSRDFFHPAPSAAPPRLVADARFRCRVATHARGCHPK